LNNNSPGLSEFGSKIGRYGIPTTVGNHSSGPAFAQEAIQQYKSGRLRSIMIIGHSLAGGAAVEMAAELGRAGVPVDLVVTLDPVGAAQVPANVRRSAGSVTASSMLRSFQHTTRTPQIGSRCPCSGAHHCAICLLRVADDAELHQLTLSMLKIYFGSELGRQLSLRLTIVHRSNETLARGDDTWAQSHSSDAVANQMTGHAEIGATVRTL
jgi:thioesterase domain-containing protein